MEVSPMLQLVAILGLGAAIAAMLAYSGKTQAAKAIGIVIIGLVVAFGGLIVFGLLFND